MLGWQVLNQFKKSKYKIKCQVRILKIKKINKKTKS